MADVCSSPGAGHRLQLPCIRPSRPTRMTQIAPADVPLVWRTTILKVGTKAPDFTGPTDTGDFFHLAEQVGRRHVVLYFYVRDFSRG